MLARACGSGSLGWKSRPGKRLREMHDVLARAAGDLQHEPARRQIAPQHGQDRLAVAGCGRSVEARVAGHAAVFSPPMMPRSRAPRCRGAEAQARPAPRPYARPAAARRGDSSVGVLAKRAAARVWRKRPTTGCSLSSRILLASTCGWAMTWSRVRTGAQGTPSASSRSSHSSVVRVLRTSWVICRRSSMFWSRSAGVLKRGIVEPFGTLERARERRPFLVAHDGDGHEPVAGLVDQVDEARGGPPRRPSWPTNVCRPMSEAHRNASTASSMERRTCWPLPVFSLRHQRRGDGLRRRDRGQLVGQHRADEARPRRVRAALHAGEARQRLDDGVVGRLLGVGARSRRSR